MKPETRRFYAVFAYCAATDSRQFLYFRADNIALARDHAAHCVRGTGLQITHVGYLGTSAPLNMGTWQRIAGVPS